MGCILDWVSRAAALLASSYSITDVAVGQQDKRLALAAGTDRLDY
jgi:hypothetical protein